MNARIASKRLVLYVEAGIDPKALVRAKRIPAVTLYRAALRHYRRIKRVPVFACSNCPCGQTCPRRLVCFQEGVCEMIILNMADGMNPYTGELTR